MAMKKILSSLCILLISLQMAMAQSEPAMKIQIGLKTGLNLNNVDGGVWKNELKTSWHGGAFVSIKLKKIGLHGEAYFSQTSYSTDSSIITASNLLNIYKNSFNAVTANKTVNVNYINFPILLQIKLIPNVWLQMGPQFSGIVNIKDTDSLLKESQDIFKNGAVAAVGGLWIDLPMNINIGARFITDLSNSNKVTTDDLWKSRLFQFHLGLKF
jgi:hypothetical protein